MGTKWTTEEDAYLVHHARKNNLFTKNTKGLFLSNMNHIKEITELADTMTSLFGKKRTSASLAHRWRRCKEKIISSNHNSLSDNDIIDIIIADESIDMEITKTHIEETSKEDDSWVLVDIKKLKSFVYKMNIWEAVLKSKIN